MTSDNKTKQTEDSVIAFVHSLSDQNMIDDSLKLVEIMSAITGHPAKMWGTSIIGFDAYHYKYASGREGDAAVIAFSPRKGKLVVYIDDTSRYPELFAKLGKHSTGKVCVYIKQLQDVDLTVFSQLVKASYDHSKSLSSEIH